MNDISEYNLLLCFQYIWIYNVRIEIYDIYTQVGVHTVLRRCLVVSGELTLTLIVVAELHDYPTKRLISLIWAIWSKEIRSAQFSSVHTLWSTQQDSARRSRYWAAFVGMNVAPPSEAVSNNTTFLFTPACLLSGVMLLFQNLSGLKHAPLEWKPAVWRPNFFGKHTRAVWMGTTHLHVNHIQYLSIHSIFCKCALYVCVHRACACLVCEWVCV